MNKMNIKRTVWVITSILTLNACSQLTYEEYKTKADKCEKEMHGKIQTFSNKGGWVYSVYCQVDGFSFEVK